MNSKKLIECPVCHNYIDATNINLHENSFIYCYNCNTYFNYHTNSRITTIQKEIYRGRKNDLERV